MLMTLMVFIATVPLFAADNETNGAEVIELEGITLESYKDGTAASGYKVDAARNLGLWDAKDVVEIPYTLSILSSELIDNIMATNPQQLYRINPTTNAGSFELNANNYFYTRGFVGNYAYVDGIPNNNISYGLNLEEFDNVVVLSGLSGFYYGFSQIGGTALYNLKRPTSEYMNKLNVGNHGNEQWYIHGDFGGPMFSNKLGYRVNVMYQKGETNIKSQELERTLVSGALDWNVNKDLLLQFNAGYSLFDREGNQMAFDIRRNDLVNGVPDPLNPKYLWAPKGTFSTIEGYNGGFNANWRINEIFRLRTAYNHKEDVRKMIYTGNANFTPDLTQYGFSISGGKWKYISDGGYAYADANFDTLGISHEVTVGVNGSYRTNETAVYNGNAIFLFGPAYTFPIWDHTSAENTPVPDWDLDGDMKRQLTSKNINFVIGDTIVFNDRWSVMGGINYTEIKSTNYNAINGDVTSEYKKEVITPSVSLLYKPLSNLTTYISYMEGLEQATIPWTGLANAGEILEPLRSKQYEGGIKAEIGAMLLTTAVFQLDKPYGYVDAANYFVQDGRQVHRGLELTATGRMFEKFTVWGGFTYLDPIVTKAANASLRYKQPFLVPKILTKLYMEYDIPFLDGLTLTGGVYYTGTRFANDQNTNELPAYLLGDLGVRYAYKTRVTDMIFRVNVTNISNERYWLDQPLGHGRAVSFSAEAGF
jgi:iron complex outermembrane receptor protein